MTFFLNTRRNQWKPSLDGIYYSCFNWLFDIKFGPIQLMIAIGSIADLQMRKTNNGTLSDKEYNDFLKDSK